MSRPKVLLLGATGRTGKLVLKFLIKKNYEVNCLVRDKSKINISDAKITLFDGVPTNIGQLEQALVGCEAVISVLNISRNTDFPWSKLRTPPTLLSDTINNLIELSSKNKIERVIVCSAYGVAETRKDLPGWFRWLIDNSNIGLGYRDHERQEDLLKKSNLNWTIVRPVGLTNSKKRKPVVVSYDNNPQPGFTITRLSVAQYMVDAIENDSLINMLPVLSS